MGRRETKSSPSQSGDAPGLANGRQSPVNAGAGGHDNGRRRAAGAAREIRRPRHHRQGRAARPRGACRARARFGSIPAACATSPAAIAISNSSPDNDRLVYLTRAEAAAYLDEIARDAWPVREIGFTGGEPFMNPDIHRHAGRRARPRASVLVLTNAMQPMLRPRIRDGMLALRQAHGGRLSCASASITIRESCMTPSAPLGPTPRPSKVSIGWRASFALALAGRTCWGESEGAEPATATPRSLRARSTLTIAVAVLFPEMDVRATCRRSPKAVGILRKTEELICAQRHGGEAQECRAARRAACTCRPNDSSLRDGKRWKRQRPGTLHSARSSSATHTAPSSACSAAGCRSV